MEMLFRDDIKAFVDKFDGRFELIDYGFPDNDYIKNGFWIELKANFNITISSFKVGKINFIIDGNQIYVDRGFLNDIGFGLRMIR